MEMCWIEAAVASYRFKTCFPFVFACPLKWDWQFLLHFLTVHFHMRDKCLAQSRPVTMNKDINAVWQSPRRAAKAGCLPSANTNSEGTRKQVHLLHNQSLPPWSITRFTHPFLVSSSLHSLAKAATEDRWCCVIPYVLWRSPCMAASLLHVMPIHCSYQGKLFEQAKLFQPCSTVNPALWARLKCSWSYT